MMCRRLFVYAALLLLCSRVNGQSDSAAKTEKTPLRLFYLGTPHSPTKAGIYSAVIPGAGQLYNRKFWKFPVVYAGMGAATYLMLDQRAKMRQLNLQFEKAYTINKDTILDANLISERDNHRRMRDFGILAMTAVYALQIIDATVDAHFFRFNIDQNLSARVHPSPSRVLTVTYQFK
jgi:hypothetical protein